MTGAKIETSARMGRAIAVCWDDGLNLFFDAKNVSKEPVVCRMDSARFMEDAEDYRCCDCGGELPSHPHFKNCGDEPFCSSECLNNYDEAELTRRIVVSRTSARVAADGTEVIS